MVLFTELRITPDGKYLIIDAQVLQECYYNEVEITNILVSTLETDRLDGTPYGVVVFDAEQTSDKDLLKVYSLPENCGCKQIKDLDSDEYCFVREDIKIKRVRLQLDASQVLADLNKNIFFVYVCTNGRATFDAPCQSDNIIGVVANMFPFYKLIIGYLKELSTDCSIPKGFLDYILKLKAYELNIKIGNYAEAVKLWKDYFLKFKVSVTNKPCGCNGRNY